MSDFSNSKINTIQSHDAFMKAAMQNIEVAKEFFATHLPEEVQNIVDLKTLAPTKDSFLDETLGNNMSDMVFKVQFGEEPGYITLLLEHQSSPQYHMPFRIMKYMLQICNAHLKANPKAEHLPLIYPMIFYHGLQEYNTPLDFWSLFKDPQLAKQFYSEPYQLINVNKISDEELRKKTYSGVMSYLLKHIFAKDISPYLEVIAPLLREISIKNFDYMTTIICYTINRAEGKNKERVLEKLTTMIPEKNRSNVMTIAEALRAEGMHKGFQAGIEKGIEKGMEKGMEKGRGEEREETAKRMLANNFDIHLIALATSLPIERIIELKQSLIILN